MKVAERRKQTQTFHFSSYPVCLPSLWFSGSHKFGKNNIHPLTLHLGIPLFLNIIFLMKLTKLLSLLKLNMSEQHITECRNCIRPSLSFLSRFPLESSNALLKMNVLIPDTLQQENTVTPLFFFQRRKLCSPRIHCRELLSACQCKQKQGLLTPQAEQKLQTALDVLVLGFESSSLQFPSLLKEYQE